MKQMSLIEKTFFLKKINIFAELELELLLAIADKMHQDFYDPNESVFTVGEKANRMYFIVSGRVQITDADKRETTVLNSPQHFGNESLFNEKDRQYNAMCLSEVFFMTLTRADLMNIISECPSIAILLLQEYASNISYCKGNGE